MAKLERDGVEGTPRGQVGNLIFAKYGDKRFVVRRRPHRTAPYSETQHVYQGRFARAVAYVKAAMADPAIKAAYASVAKEKGRRTCDIALADFLKPPIVSAVDTSKLGGRVGDTLRIIASDDFDIALVTVEIRDLHEVILDRGTAARVSMESDEWLFTLAKTLDANQTVEIEVRALDRPGNYASKRLFHVLSDREA